MANSSYSLAAGQIPSGPQWAAYFAGKVDETNGNIVNPTQTGGAQTGGTISGANLSGGQITNAPVVSGSLSFLASGTATYDGQVSMTGGGTANGYGEWQYHGSVHHFYTHDGTEQFRVGSVPNASEFFDARGGATGAGATLYARGTSGNDVWASHVAQGNGGFYFGNYNGPLLQVLCGNGSPPYVNYVKILASPTGQTVNIEAEGTDPNVSMNFFMQGGGTFFVTNSNGTIAQFQAFNITVTDSLLFKAGSSTTNPSLATISGSSLVLGGGSLATNATKGFVQLPTCAGVPTGVPAVVTGGCPLVIDTTDNRLYFYNGGWQTSNPVVPQRKMLSVATSTVGNGSDLTADTLQTFTMLANQLVNTGDMLRIVVGGRYTGSTDNKTALLKFGSATIGTFNTATSSIVTWGGEAYVVKTGSSTQNYLTIGGANGASSGSTTSNSASQTDTSTIVISVTGQNATNSVANSVTCTFFTVEYIPAGS